MKKEEIASALSHLGDVLERDFDKIDDKTLFSATGNGFTIFFVPYNDQQIHEVVTDEMNRRLETVHLSAPRARCYCTGTCSAPRIMGRQTPCPRGGVPGEKAPPATPEKPAALQEFEEPHSYDDGRGA